MARALPDSRVHFVLPSAVPAKFWVRAAAEATLEPVTPIRFIAWDTFKAQSLSVKQQEKEPINRAVRTLFTSNLLWENAQKGKSFLTDYINPAYSASYNSFISSLAKLLPALEGVLRRAEAMGTLEDPYFADLQRIRERYVAFLDEHRLYEPAWNRAAFTPSENRWFLFFPELVEDWDEYREELTSLAAQGEAGPIKIIPLDAIAPPGYQNHGAAERIREILGKYGGRYIQFSFTGEEYRWLALTIRRLLDEGLLCPEDMAISFPGSANLERLIQEFRLHDLPVTIRQGRPLTEYPGGRIFAALAACPAGRWSFQSLKNLLLDKAFPWKDTQLIDGLMDFGLRYRCVSGFIERGRVVDVWEQTFKYHPHFKHDVTQLSVFEIQKFYTNLKEHILNVVQAPRFRELARAWHQFETSYFNKDAFDPAVNKLIARAIKVLEELADMEERFPGLSKGAGGTGRVFPVFQAYLQEQMYVYQSGTPGIPLYDYKVAAGICPVVHFIINMNQEDAAVVYTGGASFLREDRKSGLGIQDRDISGEFIQAYRFSAYFPVFTLSLRTFNGHGIPHRRLSELLGQPLSEDTLEFPADPYAMEASLAGGKGGTRHSQVYPSDIQKQGWQRLNIVRKPPLAGDLREKSITDGELRFAVKDRLTRQAFYRKPKQPDISGKEGMYYLAPTDLNEYSACPFAWVLERGLLIREKQTEIKTIDQRELGSLYHRILERLFKRIQEAGGRFRAEDLAQYKRCLGEETQEALKEARSKEGVFQESIYAMLERRIVAALNDYLKEDLPTLNGAEILGAEYILQKTYSPGEPRLTGKADMALEYESGGLILTDFKTNKIPAKKEVFAGDRDIPENLQMAAYIAMLEYTQGGTAQESRDEKQKVKTAQFYSIDKRQFLRVVSENEENEKKIKPRSAYDKEVAAVDRVFTAVREAMEQGNYQGQKGKHCRKCRVSSVCRIPFIGGEKHKERGD
jgi:RecB family exonuclease